MTSTNFPAILILFSCLVVSRLQSNEAEVPGFLFRDFFFQCHRPTQYQKMHSTLNETKKGDGLIIKKILQRNRLYIIITIIIIIIIIIVIKIVIAIITLPSENGYG